MVLSHSDIEKIYKTLRDKAFLSFDKENYLQSLDHIVFATRWAYQLNFQYVDEKLEHLIKNVADSCLPKLKIDSCFESRFVLLDTHGLDNRGLTQQYIRAFMAMGVEFLYISVSCQRSKCVDIVKELEGYERAKILLYEDEKTDYLEKAIDILSEIKLYQPTKLFLHLMPWDVVSLLISYSIQGVIKYNINLTDHAFWLGASFIDYNFEFRAYGKTVSLEKRHLKQEQLLYLPYYPILPKNKIEFQGFPIEAKDKIVIFTGGAFYKMFGNNDLFFKILDELLDLSENAVVLVAGIGDKYTMNEKLAHLRNRHRIMLIGNRRDINEVFKACDVYLDTYPIRGGLMEQYASLYEKPILAYSDFQNFGDVQESMLCRFGNGVCGYNSWQCFIDYARKILEDVAFRREEGLKNKQLVPNVSDFNSNFMQLITTHQNVYNWDFMQVSYDKVKDLYLEVETLYTHTAVRCLMKNLKLKVIRYFPQYIFYFFQQLLAILYSRLVLKK